LEPSTFINQNYKTALLLVDIQKGLDDWAYYGGNRNNTDAEENASKILNRFRKLGWPIFHVQHSSTNTNSPLHPSKPGFQLKDEVKPMPDEPVIVKKVNSAFIGTNLEQRLKDSKIDTLVIVGLTTNHCISTTTRMASNLGFRTYLISDATATFDRKGLNGAIFEAELIHQTCLANLNEEFARLPTTKELLEVLT
jgi:nicotinamidase-related amidase